MDMQTFFMAKDKMRAEIPCFSTENIQRNLMSEHYANYQKLFLSGPPSGISTCDHSQQWIWNWWRTTTYQERLSTLVTSDLTDQVKADEAPHASIISPFVCRGCKKNFGYGRVTQTEKNQQESEAREWERDEERAHLRQQECMDPLLIIFPLAQWSKRLAQEIEAVELRWSLRVK